MSYWPESPHNREPARSPENRAHEYARASQPYGSSGQARAAGHPPHGAYAQMTHPHGQQPHGQHPHGQHHGQHAYSQQPKARPQAPQTGPQPRRMRRNTDYTLGHGRRQVRIGPVAFWIVVGTLVIMAGWSVATGTYFAFHDDVLKRMIARQAQMQFAYEDRIAELRAQIDRISSRQLLDQEQFEQKLEMLVRKQTMLESRAATLSALPEGSGAVATKPALRTSPHGRTSSLKQPDGEDITGSIPPADQQARFDPAGRLNAMARAVTRKLRGGMDGTLTRVKDSLDRVEAQQMASLSTLEENYSSRARKIRGILTEIGIDPGKPPASVPGSARTAKLASAVGGPYVPVPLRNDAGSFDREVYRVHLARAHVLHLDRSLTSAPVRKPVDGEMSFSSTFGVRTDPFLKSPAMHTGIDMRGDTGDPARTTAAGRVTFAGTNGGYGKMVEIDHGNGLSTRYGHLSAIDVSLGQRVKTGQIIGKIGSTGRSTGPHLHYETRVNGDAVNPNRYLQAGRRLGLY